MSMKRSLQKLWLGVVACIVVATPMLAAESWTYGGVTYHLPPSKQSPVLPANIPQSHVVVAGDTLWDIAGRHLGDPFFWPLVWEINMDQVSNPHLIFPGQTLLLPGGGGAVLPGAGAGVLPPAGMPGEQPPTPEELASEVERQFQTRPEPETYPASQRSTLIRSGYLASDRPRDPRITGAEVDGMSLSTGDVVYINSGADDGVKAGDRFYVLDPTRRVQHPETGRNLGWLVIIPGILKVVCVQPESATAEVVEAFAQIQREMPVVPYYDIEMPMTYGPPSVDPCEPGPGDVVGRIVDTYTGGELISDATILGQGSVVYLDVGTRDGVVAGDYFSVWKTSLAAENRPPHRAGELILLRVEESSASGFVTRSQSPLFVGDRVGLIK